MKKSKTSFFCQHCGYMSPKWLGRCPSCNGWNCFAEELVSEPDSGSRAEMAFNGKPMPIEEIPAEEGERTLTGIAEIDRVLIDKNFLFVVWSICGGGLCVKKISEDFRHKI